MGEHAWVSRRPQGRAARAHAPEPVYSVTGANFGRTVDLHSREVRYAISMGIRTLCFILAVVTSGWVRYVAFAGAVFLPYFAVVMANAAQQRGGADLTPVTPQPIPLIEAAPHASADSADNAADEAADADEDAGPDRSSAA